MAAIKKASTTQLVQALVAWPGLKGIGDPGARPILRGKMKDALRIGLTKPWRCVELGRNKGIIGRMAHGAVTLTDIGRIEATVVI
jgi:hypothetical protein